jgi:hypothetical protein
MNSSFRGVGRLYLNPHSGKFLDPVAKFLVPDIFDSGIGLSYPGGPVQQPHAIVDHIPESGTKNLVTDKEKTITFSAAASFLAFFLAAFLAFFFSLLARASSSSSLLLLLELEDDSEDSAFFA